MFKRVKNNNFKIFAQTNIFLFSLLLFVQTLTAQSVANEVEIVQKYFNDVSEKEKLWWSGKNDRIFNRLQAELKAGKKENNKSVYHQLAIFEACFGNNEEAIVYYDSAFRSGISEKDSIFWAIEKSEVYFKIGAYEEAISCLLANKKKNSTGLSAAYLAMQIAKAHLLMGNIQNYNEHIENPISVFYANKDSLALLLTMQLEAQELCAGSNFDLALEMTMSALDIAETQNNKRELLNVFCLLGQIYLEKKDFKRALDTFLSALNLAKEEEYPVPYLKIYLGLAEGYFMAGDEENLQKVLFKAEEIATQKSEKSILIKCYQLWVDYFKHKNNLQQQIYYTEKILNIQNAIIQKRLNKRFILSNDFFLIQEEKLNFSTLKANFSNIETINKKLVIFLTIACLVIISLFIWAIIKHKKSQKQELLLINQALQEAIIAQKNIAIEVQTKEILNRRAEIQKITTENHKAKNKLLSVLTEIKLSSEFTKKIQNAHFQKSDAIKASVKDFFVYRNPKDFLNSDLFWSAKITDNQNPTHEKIFIVIINNTLSGIPAALLSIVANDLLNNIVKENGIEDLKKISDVINTEMNLMLNDNLMMLPQNRNFDISLALIDKFSSSISVYNPLNTFVIIKNEKFYDLKETINCITFKPEEYCVLYAFSDGYIDQISSATKRKFGKNKFFALLTEIYEKPMLAQKMLIEETFRGWKGDSEQIDDVLVVGILI